MSLSRAFSKLSAALQVILYCSDIDTQARPEQRHDGGKMGTVTKALE